MASDVDIWMPLDIGKYLSRTMHLTTLQHGSYLLLLMHYWKHGPLTNNQSLLSAICRQDASSIAWADAWAVLAEFFPLAGDGLLHNEKADKEMAKAVCNQESASKKGKKAADARWSKQCPKDAPSNAQAMPQNAPSPSPIYIKPSAKNAVADERHGPVREFIKSCITHATGLPTAPWNGRDAKILQRMLESNPSWDVETFKKLIRNRFRSEGIPRGDPAHKWIPDLPKYANGPLNKFNQELSDGTNQQAGIIPSRQQARNQSNREKLAKQILGIDLNGDARPGGSECEVRTLGE